MPCVCVCATRCMCGVSAGSVGGTENTPSETNARGAARHCLAVVLGSGGGRGGGRGRQRREPVELGLSLAAERRHKNRHPAALAPSRPAARARSRGRQCRHVRTVVRTRGRSTRVCACENFDGREYRRTSAWLCTLITSTISWRPSESRYDARSPFASSRGGARAGPGAGGAVGAGDADAGGFGAAAAVAAVEPAEPVAALCSVSFVSRLAFFAFFSRRFSSFFRFFFSFFSFLSFFFLGLSCFRCFRLCSVSSSLLSLLPSLLLSLLLVHFFLSPQQFRPASSSRGRFMGKLFALVRTGRFERDVRRFNLAVTLPAALLVVSCL